MDATNARLQSVGLAHVGHAVRADHAGLADILKKEGRPCAVMFNLGYLPGGSHALFTTPRSSLPAMDAALAALVRGGALTVCAYSGGLQGTTERDAVLSWARVLAPQAYQVDIRLFEHEAGNPPVAVCIEKKCAPRPPHCSCSPCRPGRSRGGAFWEGKSHRLARPAKEPLLQAPGEADHRQRAGRT